jgi:hypothetical protein
MNKEQSVSSEDMIDVGESLLDWETWEYPPHERGRLWFVLAAIVGAALLVFSLATTNYLFAIVILMIGVVMFMSGMRHPDRITIHITDLGVVVGDHFHDYKDIKDFSVIYDPPDTKLLYLDFNQLWEPLHAIPLEDVDPVLVRDNLLPYVYENLAREEETLTDVLRRVYKL